MRPLQRARVMVVDLGFGDAGKGTLTDWLVRTLDARAIVRFNGGAQAGHNVVTDDGRHHTFAQFGAGSFVPGVQTFLSKHVVFHPTALLVEAEHLSRVGVPYGLERVHVSEECLVTTPVHQAATCIRELARGDARHGSCGVGVGETMRDAIAAPRDALRARDLHDVPHLMRRLALLQESKRSELALELGAMPRSDLAEAQRLTLEDPAILTAWVEQTRAIVERPIIQDDRALRGALTGPGAVIFEGAQGALLDEWVGFHPFTTWSTCTFQNALSLLDEHDSEGDRFRLGVLRSIATRHGAGPFPTESADVPAGVTREHNDTGPWQGRFRTGWLDAVLARYALAACGGVDGLALTHLDRFLPGAPWQIATRYDLADAGAALVSRSVTGQVEDLRVGPRHDLRHVQALGRALLRARPSYQEVTAPPGAMHRAMTSAVEAALGSQVVVTSTGPTPADKTTHDGRLARGSASR